MTSETESGAADSRRRILFDIAGFASSQYTLRFTYIIKGFLVARILGPVGTGMWQHFVLLFEYGLHSHVGLLPGLSKYLGHVIGRGDDLSALDARRSGVGGVLLSAVILFLGILGYVAFEWDSIHPVDRWGVPLVGLVVVIEQLTNAYKANLRAYSRIGIITRASFMFAISHFIVAVGLLLVLPAGYKLFGLVIGWVSTRAGTTLWLIRASGYPLQPQLDPGMMRILMTTGFPIFLFHLSQVALRNIDRVLVDMTLGKENLGIYGIAVALATLVRFGAEAVAFVIYPIFLRRYGETRDRTALRRQLERPTAFLALFVPLGLGLSYLVLHLPVLWLLPQFVPSIEIFRMLTVSVVFSCLAILPGFYLMAIDRQNWLVPVGFATVAFNYFFGHRLVEAGYGMLGVAMAMGAGSFFYCTTILFFSGWWSLGSVVRSLWWIAQTYAPVGYFAAVVVLIRWWIPLTPLGAWEEVPRSLTEGALFLAVGAPLPLFFERRIRFLQSLREERARGSG